MRLHFSTFKVFYAEAMQIATAVVLGAPSSCRVMPLNLTFIKSTLEGTNGVDIC
jgi:hypothetical protein